MQNLKPTIDNIKRLYGDDKDKVQRETTALYEKAGVKPLAGEATPTPQTAPSMPVCASTLSNRTLLMPPLAALLPHQPAPCVLAAQASPGLGDCTSYPRQPPLSTYTLLALAVGAIMQLCG